MASLLAHLAGHFTTQGEYLATEGLGHILQESSSAREAIASVLNGATGLGVRVTSVSTQVANVGHHAGATPGSRPDLTLYGKGDHLVAFVEGKFWAGLTDAQPVDYLKALRTQGGRVLLFVVPEERILSLLPELGSRIDGAGLAKPSWRNTEKARVCSIDQTTSLVVTSWTAVMGTVKEACANVAQLREIREKLAGLPALEGAPPSGKE